LQKTHNAIDKTSADPALKRRATEELTHVTRRIGTVYDTLLANLRVSLGETHLRFTTEIDIYCPIATEMKTCYERAQLVTSGQGVYKRQRNALRDSIFGFATYHPGRPVPAAEALRPLLKKIEEKIVNTQKEKWNSDCEIFVGTVMDEIRTFEPTTEQLLRNASYMAAEHKEARGLSRTLLAEFDAGLEDLQGRFVGEVERPGKKARFVGTQEGYVEQEIKQEEEGGDVQPVGGGSAPLLGWNEAREEFGGRLPRT
jgi:hypothetical protein